MTTNWGFWHIEVVKVNILHQVLCWADGGSRIPAISKMPLFASSSGQLEVINHYQDDPILAAKVLDPLLLGAYKRAWVRIGKQRKAKDTKNEKLNFRYL